MRTSTNIDADQRHLTLAITSMRSAVEGLHGAADHTAAAGRYGWSSELESLARRVHVWEQTIEDNR
jgi:hypothetical protein